MPLRILLLFSIARDGAVASVSARPVSHRLLIVHLGTLGGPFSSENAINKRNQVVGVSFIDAFTLHTFLCEDGVMIGTLPGGYVSEAT